MFSNYNIANNWQIFYWLITTTQWSRRRYSPSDSITSIDCVWSNIYCSKCSLKTHFFPLTSMTIANKFCSGSLIIRPSVIETGAHSKRLHCVVDHKKGFIGTGDVQSMPNDRASLTVIAYISITIFSFLRQPISDYFIFYFRIYSFPSVVPSPSRTNSFVIFFDITFKWTLFQSKINMPSEQNSATYCDATKKYEIPRVIVLERFNI